MPTRGLESSASPILRPSDASKKSLACSLSQVKAVGHCSVVTPDKETGHELQEAADSVGVRLIWSTDVEDLIFRSACRFISDPDRQMTSNDPTSEFVSPLSKEVAEVETG
jgi:hypothetical protein